MQYQEDRPNPIEFLTRREQEILEHLDEGLTNREIAEAMVIAESTVKGYTRQIYQKLGITSRREAVQRAREVGLLAPSGPGSTISTNLPTGTVTFLFSDIEGSTPLWEQHPELMEDALEIHNSALREAIEKNGGVVFKTIGDAFQAAFSTASQALQAAIDGQKALMQASWNELGSLKVRMGLHTGEAQLDPGGDEYAVSHTKNRVARIMSAAHGGQILLSQEIADLVRRILPEEAWLKDLGEHHLKGLSIPEHLFQVCAPGLVEAFPELATAILRLNNLPVQLTSFIGRQKEKGEVKELLRQQRLVTLTGVGGTGKTRLAISVGQELLEDFTDGVFFVNLAPVRQPEMVLSAIAQVFSLHEIPTRSLKDVLKEHLAKKRLLLILDNFEQVIEAGPEVQELLLAAPGIKALVTSRALLRLSGEVDYPLQPLEVPLKSQISPELMLKALEENEAIRLFVERARAVSPGFCLNTENASTVAEICRRLDGLPLAIELAAPRLRLFTPEQMLQHLKRSLDLLVGGARDLPARHQTMRAAIEWSVALLSEQKKRLFHRMGVFAGGCTLAAASAVCEVVDKEHPADKVDVLSGIESLLDISLLRRNERTGEARFWMFETIREYTLEQLERSGERDAVNRAFARYFTREELFQDFNQKELEIDNLRAVFRWSIDSGDVAPGLLLGGDFLFWMTHAAEARRVIKELLATPAAHTAEERVECVYGAASLAYFNGDLLEAQKLFDEYEDLIRQSPNRDRLLDFSLYARAFMEAAWGNYAQAILEVQGFIRWAESMPHHFYRQVGLSALASYDLVLGNVARARELLIKAVEIPYESNLGIYNNYERRAELGWCDLEEGKPDEAEPRFKEGMFRGKESGYRILFNLCMKGLAAVALKHNLLEHAARLYGATEQVSILLGHTALVPGWETMHQRYFARLREQIDPAVFERAFQEGRCLGLDEALDFALES